MTDWSDFIKALASLIFVIGVSTGPFIYHGYDEQQENEVTHVQQAQQISSLSNEVTALKVDLSKLQVLSSIDTGWPDRPGICLCVAKDNSKKPRTKQCYSKNPACDEESSKLCEARNEDYEC